MSKKQIIPAIDLKDGNVVRLKQGDYMKETVYNTDPLQMVKKFVKFGSNWLHIINLDSAKTGNFRSSKNYQTILKIINFCSKIGMRIQLGGGLRNIELIQDILKAGVSRVILGTLAFEQPDQLDILLKKYKEQIIISLDVLDNTLRTRGWLKDTNTSLKDAILRFEQQGVNHFIVTNIEKDGMSSGFNANLYNNIRKLTNTNCKIIAAGGLSSTQDIRKALQYCDGVIIGRALYNDAIDQNDLKDEIDRLNGYTTLVKRIIPCLDVKAGRVVKGVKFKNLKDAGDPVELARYYNEHGADELIFLDISATLEGRKSMIDIIHRVAEEVFIPFGVGGGIRSLEDMEQIINAGAEKISINSAAVQNPALITQGAAKFGSQSIIVAIDAKRQGDHWEVYTHAGSKATGLDAVDWAKQVENLGVGELLVTSMDQDGTQSGYDVSLLRKICHAVSIPVIASGGAGRFIHFKEAIDVGAEAVLAASLFHYDKMSIWELKRYLSEHNISTRSVRR